VKFNTENSIHAAISLLAPGRSFWQSAARAAPDFFIVMKGK
jgi:hypothetical protein